jgi:hypothetical protein
LIEFFFFDILQMVFESCFHYALHHEGMGMIRGKEFEKFEMEFLRREKLDVKRNFEIAEALYHVAVSLGIIPLKDPLDGIEVDLRIARVINGVSKTA